MGKLSSSLDKVETKSSFHFCSVTNMKKMESVFSQYRPQLVFHAAAHKHVPMMEHNIDEAILNNISGTKITADFSEQFEVEKFVLVSTDKVVRPTSVMGMTKKIAEKYIRHMANDSKTQFMIVRFGNVLGSNGSIVPLFKKQIERGGPVTVTHPEMERYFMLIPEAVQLILQAGTLGRGGEIFLLEMGEPVKILDLANKIIRLSGHVPGEGIEVKFTGIRPGEKLHEELVDEGETAKPTLHRKIRQLESSRIEPSEFIRRLEMVCDSAGKINSNKLRQMIFEMVSSGTIKPIPNEAHSKSKRQSSDQ